MIGPVSVPALSEQGPAEEQDGLRRKKWKSSSLKIGDTLSAFEQIVEERKAAEPEPVEEEAVVEYGLNPGIQIPEEAFRRELGEVVKVLQDGHKMNLASAIREGKNELHHNRWSLAVANELLMGFVERERGFLLPAMRSRLGVAELFLELSVDISLAESKTGLPYTDEQKLQVMLEENPAIRKLQEIFKARIIY